MMAKEHIVHTIQIEIEDEKLKAMLKSYGIPVNEENIEDLLDRLQDDMDSDLELNLENVAATMADDLGIIQDD